MVTPPKELRKIESFRQIVKALLGPEGCPWDKAQTHASLIRFAIEEVQELAEAIDSECYKSICDELGDLLLQVFLHAEIAQISGHFSLEDVIESISQKMIRRHPHVFSDLKTEDMGEIWKNWDQIKAKEKDNTPPQSFQIPKNLSELIKAHKIGDKTRQLHFDWQQPDQVLHKLDEEICELKQAIKDGHSHSISHELGDVLFTTVQLARHLELDAEGAIRKTNKRFETRFFNMLELSGLSKQDFEKLPDEKKEELWKKVKSLEID